MYNDIIINNFSDPENVGELAIPDVKYELGNPVCGDRIEIHLALKDNKIDEAKFRAWGCATSIATANIFCSSIKDTSIEQIQARNTDEIADMLGELEPSQQHCVEMLNELHIQLLALIGANVSVMVG